MPWLPIFPPQASSFASEVDALVFFMLVCSVLIVGAIFTCITVFCLKYRRRPGHEIGTPSERTLPLELTWTGIPLVLALIPFVWGARLYLTAALPPSDAMEVYVVAKQWMWKTEQPGGQSEIDELHVPVGRPVKLTMTSQDVIHSFYVPAFRVKADVLPGRYTTVWFQATEPGTYRLFCSQYCGTDHAAMVGQVVAMTPADFGAWLTTGDTAFQAPAALGRKLFQQYGCTECHETGHAPPLAGLYGTSVYLSDGTTVLADENYIRESILDPSAQIVNGYQPIMPSFAGRLSEDDVLDLVAYIQSIGSTPGAVPPPRPALLPVPQATPPAVPSPVPGQ